MPIKTRCPGCGAELVYSDRLAGKAVRCPKCKKVLKVPPAQTTARPAPVSAPAPEKTRDKKSAEVATDKIWFVIVEGDAYGPFDVQDMRGMLQEGRIAQDTITYCEGMPRTPLVYVPQLALQLGFDGHVQKDVKIEAPEIDFDNLSIDRRMTEDDRERHVKIEKVQQEIVQQERQKEDEEKKKTNLSAIGGAVFGAAVLVALLVWLLPKLGQSDLDKSLKGAVVSAKKTDEAKPGPAKTPGVQPTAKPVTKPATKPATDDGAGAGAPKPDDGVELTRLAGMLKYDKAAVDVRELLRDLLGPDGYVALTQPAAETVESENLDREKIARLVGLLPKSFTLKAFTTEQWAWDAVTIFTDAELEVLKKTEPGDYAEIETLGAVLAAVVRGGGKRGPTAMALKDVPPAKLDPDEIVRALEQKAANPVLLRTVSEQLDILRKKTAGLRGELENVVTLRDRIISVGRELDELERFFRSAGLMKDEAGAGEFWRALAGQGIGDLKAAEEWFGRKKDRIVAAARDAMAVKSARKIAFGSVALAEELEKFVNESSVTFKLLVLPAIEFSRTAEECALIDGAIAEVLKTPSVAHLDRLTKLADTLKSAAAGQVCRERAGAFGKVRDAVLTNEFNRRYRELRVEIGMKNSSRAREIYATIGAEGLPVPEDAANDLREIEKGLK